MNGLLSKIEPGKATVFAVVVVALITTAGNIYATWNSGNLLTTLAPFKQDLRLMDNKVEAYEDRLGKLENNSVSAGERQLVLERLTRLESKVDNIYQLLLER